MEDLVSQAYGSGDADAFTANVTDVPLDPGEEENALIKYIMVTSQYIMTIIGALANLFTLVVLRKSASAFSPVYLYLLKAQSIIDFIVCLSGTLLVLQPPMWFSGNYVFDTIVCQFWHSQWIYFTSIFFSIWNLIVIAVERYLAICKPFKHGDFTMGRAYKSSLFLVFAALVCNFPGAMQVRMKGTRCVNEYFIRGEAGEKFFNGTGYWFFVVYYSGPAVIMAIIYGQVIKTLVTRRDESSLGESRLVNSAAKQMTNTAIAVTFIFVFSLSWDVWYYMLGRAGAVIYRKNSIIQLIGLWLSSLNSCANPFVYFALLPAFRKSTLSIFCPCMKVDKKPAGGKDTSGIDKS